MEILFYIGLASAIFCVGFGLNEVRLLYKAQKKYPDICHYEKFLDNIVWIISNISAIAMYAIFDELFYKFWVIYCFVAMFFFVVFCILRIIFMNIIKNICREVKDIYREVKDIHKKKKEKRIKKEELKRPKLKFKV